MSNSNDQVLSARNNFASRLLSQAINDRKSLGGRYIFPSDANQYANGDIQAQEAALTGKH